MQRITPQGVQKGGKGHEEEAHRAEKGARPAGPQHDVQQPACVLDRLLPGASNTTKRALAQKRMRTLSTAFNAAYDRMNAHAQEVARQIAKDWLEQLEKAAADPSHACSTDARTLMATEASYLTQLMDGVWWSYLCRRKECCFFGQNNVMTWIKHSRHYYFRCPMCATQHMPHAHRDSFVKGKRVLTLYSPLTDNHPRYIMCENPPSEDDRWLNNMVELQARDIKTAEDVQSWVNRSALDLENLIKKEEIRAESLWQPIAFDKSRHFASYGSDWDDSPMRERGHVLGAFLPPQEAAREPFSDWNGLIAILSNHVAASRAMGRLTNVTSHVTGTGP